MTLDEFLAWEAKQELKHEFDGFRPVAMTGGTANHARIGRNIVNALSRRLASKPCEVFNSDLGLRTAAGFRYPDAMVVCTPVSGNALSVSDPTVVFEVISDSTGATDRFTKRREYQAIPSLRRYIIVEQGGPAASVYARPRWREQPVEGLDAVLVLPKIEAELPFAEIYAGLEFGPVPG